MNKSILEMILGGKDPTNLDLSSVENLIAVLRNMLIGLAAFEAVVGLILVAFTYFTAFGDEAKAEKAKKRIYFIIIGTIIIILAEVLIYEVARFFNPAFDNLPPPPVKPF